MTASTTMSKLPASNSGRSRSVSIRWQLWVSSNKTPDKPESQQTKIISFLQEYGFPVLSVLLFFPNTPFVCMHFVNEILTFPKKTQQSTMGIELFS